MPCVVGNFLLLSAQRQQSPSCCPCGRAVVSCGHRVSVAGVWVGCAAVKTQVLVATWHWGRGWSHSVTVVVTKARCPQQHVGADVHCPGSCCGLAPPRDDPGCVLRGKMFLSPVGDAAPHVLPTLSMACVVSRALLSAWLGSVSGAAAGVRLWFLPGVPQARACAEVCDRLVLGWECDKQLGVHGCPPHGISVVPHLGCRPALRQAHTCWGRQGFLAQVAVRPGPLCLAWQLSCCHWTYTWLPCHVFQ